MSRYNIFNQIHKGLRALLYDTALTLQQTWFTNAEETAIALGKVKKAVDIFDKHAEHEDRFVLPAIVKYEPALVDLFEKEHEEDHALSQGLRDLIKVYHHAIQAGVKIETGQAINRAFTSFMMFNLEHMNKEETVLSKILWRYYTDAELAALNKEIVASIPMDELVVTSTWMMRGLSVMEIRHWLKAVEKESPSTAFHQLLDMAERELAADRFRVLQESLTEGVMVA